MKKVTSADEDAEANARNAEVDAGAEEDVTITKNFILPLETPPPSDSFTAQMREENGIRVAGGVCCPPPSLSVSDAQLPGLFGTFMQRARLVVPSPIQAQVWPCALTGLDLIAVGSTGTLHVPTLMPSCRVPVNLSRVFLSFLS